MVVGTLSLGQKRQTSGRSVQWTQWNSDIWWWGHCSLVQKGQTSECNVQWTQWNSDIWWWGHCLWYKKVKPEDAVDAVDAVCSRCSRIVVYGDGDIVFHAKMSNQRMQWMQYVVY